MDYAIETIDLVKRYPVSARKFRGKPHHFRHPSFSGILNAIRGARGPFIEALRGVNLKVNWGEVFGVLGPNGAGKTTLIKILCTLILPDGGEAYVAGYDVVKEGKQVLKNLQVVLPESRGFSWRLTGRQNLKFYALLYGLRDREAKERIDYLLKFAGLEEQADDMYQRYSTGMQRKLLLCRALLQDASILLFDEPTAGLDPASAAEFRMLLHKMARNEGKTIFLSTHNLYEAQEICDRIAILDRGKITACDTPDNIRYMLFDEKVVQIAFINAFFNDEENKMVDELQEICGVHGVTPEVNPDGSLQGISIRVDKNMDLSNILKIIVKNGLSIKSVNTLEPTLEDAFIAITRQHPWRSDRHGGRIGWRSQ